MGVGTHDEQIGTDCVRLGDQSLADLRTIGLKRTTDNGNPACFSARIWLAGTVLWSPFSVSNKT